ncbi:unnamed protein product [Closterium sp. Naga37s-1]|nr:unnamed protein product [Closterium sp. Naga37s-1]
MSNCRSDPADPFEAQQEQRLDDEEEAIRLLTRLERSLDAAADVAAVETAVAALLAPNVRAGASAVASAVVDRAAPVLPPSAHRALLDPLFLSAPLPSALDALLPLLSASPSAYTASADEELLWGEDGGRGMGGHGAEGSEGKDVGDGGGGAAAAGDVLGGGVCGRVAQGRRSTIARKEAERLLLLAIFGSPDGPTAEPVKPGAECTPAVSTPDTCPNVTGAGSMAGAAGCRETLVTSGGLYRFLVHLESSRCTLAASATSASSSTSAASATSAAMWRGEYSMERVVSQLASVTDRASSHAPSALHAPHFISSLIRHTLTTAATIAASRSSSPPPPTPPSLLTTNVWWQLVTNKDVGPPLLPPFCHPFLFPLPCSLRFSSSFALPSSPAPCHSPALPSSPAPPYSPPSLLAARPSLPSDRGIRAPALVQSASMEKQIYVTAAAGFLLSLPRHHNPQALSSSVHHSHPPIRLHPSLLTMLLKGVSTHPSFPHFLSSPLFLLPVPASDVLMVRLESPLPLVRLMGQRLAFAFSVAVHPDRPPMLFGEFAYERGIVSGGEEGKRGGRGGSGVSEGSAAAVESTHEAAIAAALNFATGWDVGGVTGQVCREEKRGGEGAKGAGGDGGEDENQDVEKRGGEGELGKEEREEDDESEGGSEEGSEEESEEEWSEEDWDEVEEESEEESDEEEEDAGGMGMGVAMGMGVGVGMSGEGGGMAAPMQLRYCAADLRKADDVSAMERALLSLEPMIRCQPDELDDVAAELARSLIHMQCQFLLVGEEPEGEEGEEESGSEMGEEGGKGEVEECEVEEWGSFSKTKKGSREEEGAKQRKGGSVQGGEGKGGGQRAEGAEERRRASLVALVVFSPVASLEVLLGEVFSAHLPGILPGDLGQPEMAKAMLAAADGGGFGLTGLTGSWTKSFARDLPRRPGDRILGQEKRTSEAIEYAREKLPGSSGQNQQHQQLHSQRDSSTCTPPRVRFADVAAGFMLPLMRAYDRQSHGVDWVGRDFVVLAHVLLLLGKCLRLLAPSPSLLPLAAALLEFINASPIALHPEPYVQRCAIFAAASLLLSLPPAAVAAEGLLLSSAASVASGGTATTGFGTVAAAGSGSAGVGLSGMLRVMAAWLGRLAEESGDEQTKAVSAETKAVSAETKVVSAETKAVSAETKAVSAETKAMAFGCLQLYDDFARACLQAVLGSGNPPT